MARRTPHRSSRGASGVAQEGGITTELTYAQAVDEALCFGWIDGQVGRRDDHTYCVRFTPRTARSKWSAKNVANVERLAGLGLMDPAGDAAVRAAKTDGRWDAAYAGQAAAELPQDFLDALAGHPLAQEKLGTLGATERYAIYYRLHAVKGAETRRKKIAEYVARLDAGAGIF